MARKRGVGLFGVAAQLLADDVVPAGALQVAAVLGGLKAAVGDPHDTAEAPLAQLVFDLADQRLIACLAGPAPRPDRDPRPRHGEPDDDLRQIVAMILGMPVDAKRRMRDAVLVDRRAVGLVALEVRRGTIYPEDATDVIDHAELQLGDGRVMAGTPREEGLDQAVGGTSMYWVIHDEAEIDAIHARAVAAGAESVFATYNADYGGRHCSLRDPDGHAWSFGTYRGRG